VKKRGIMTVCGNGLGHFRRSMRVAYALLKSIEDVCLDIFCHPAQIKATSGWEIRDKLLADSRVNFRELIESPVWQIDPGFYTGHNLIDWYRYLPKEIFHKADFVISDNLPAILHLNSETVLMGSFLWSEILIKKYPNENLVCRFHEEETAILEKYQPYMICLADMAMPYVLEYTKPVETSWVVESSGNGSVKYEIGNILVSGGGTAHADKEMIGIIESLQRLGNYRVHTSARLAKACAPCASTDVFDFSARSFDTIDLMICRPGIGSLTDAVAYTVPLLATGENGNPELVFNANKAEVLGFGINLYASDVSVTDCVAQLDKTDRYLAMQHTLKNTPRNGLRETLDFLTSHFHLPVHEPY
jgi:hypothetical protein